MLPTGMKRATIKDVAQAAGVSVTTVSNVLNDRVDAMSPDTLERVRAVIASLNYRPSSLARSLVTGHPTTIALIIAEIGTPLFLQAISTIEPLVRQAGYDLIFSYARGIDDERQVVEMLREKNVDGVAFLSTSCYADDDHILLLQKSGVPVVLINRATDNPELDQVRWDNTGGVASAVDHLASLGHQRIAHLKGPDNRRSTDERLKGYRIGMEKNGLTFRPDWVQTCDFDAPAESWRQAMRQLMTARPRPSAVIGSDDNVTAVAMSEAQRAGWRVPLDVALVGIDDQPFCQFLNPALTTVRLPIAEAGKTAMSLLLQRIAAPGKEPESVMLPCPLVVRESCGAGRAPVRPGITSQPQTRPERPAAQDRPIPEERPQQTRLW